jgi:O-methyltransferase involved in polyketide biosynthesis
MAVDLRVDVPHSARIYDYVLGGKDNFDVDRAVAEKMMAASPLLAPSMRANRRFMARVARHFAGRGFRQFLDIGTGLPTHPNLHEIVQKTVTDADIVYVDNDPLVLAHARALLTPAEGSTGTLAYLNADLHDPAAIFAAPEIGVFDLTQPVAVTMLAVLQLMDDDTAHQVIGDIMGRLAPGSALAISAVCDADDPAGVAQILTVANAGGVPVRARNQAGIEALFEGLDLEATGVVAVHRWHPADEDTTIAGQPAGMYGGVAYKP